MRIDKPTLEEAIKSNAILAADNNRLRIEVAGLQAQVDRLERAADAKSLYRQRPDFADKG